MKIVDKPDKPTDDPEVGVNDAFQSKIIKIIVFPFANIFITLR